MRLWSVHPSYLDAKGLVALWREGLLALHVLSGKTKGYTRHPQLIRFREQADSITTITAYLHAVVDEADVRGYSFDRSKLPQKQEVALIEITTGQLAFETDHLKSKLSKRDPEKYQILEKQSTLTIHPSFVLIDGPVAEWEKI